MSDFGCASRTVQAGSREARTALRPPSPVNELCEFAGHEWEDAGGGLEICVECEADRWAAPVPAAEGTEEP
jgi:hypothetical protein